MATASIFVLRVSFSCLLPLWEALQDEQVGESLLLNPQKDAGILGLRRRRIQSRARDEA